MLIIKDQVQTMVKTLEHLSTNGNRYLLPKEIIGSFVTLGNWNLTNAVKDYSNWLERQLLAYLDKTNITSRDGLYHYESINSMLQDNEPKTPEDMIVLLECLKNAICSTYEYRSQLYVYEWFARILIDFILKNKSEDSHVN
jgi:hypothetical protein